MTRPLSYPPWGLETSQPITFNVTVDPANDVVRAAAALEASPKVQIWHLCIRCMRPEMLNN